MLGQGRASSGSVQRSWQDVSGCRVLGFESLGFRDLGLKKLGQIAQRVKCKVSAALPCGFMRWGSSEKRRRERAARVCRSCKAVAPASG